MFTFNPKSYAPREVKAFKQAVIARLQQTEDDAAIDNRSIESVAWMADELHRRIDWYFNAKQYVNSASIDDAEVVPEFLRTLVFARPRGDDQFADCTFSPSLDMSR